MLAQQFAVYVVVYVFENIEDYPYPRIFARLDGYLGGTPIGEPELAGRDTAEGNTAAPLLFGQIQAGAVTCRQLFLLPGSGDTVGYYRTYGVDDKPGGQVISRRDNGSTGGYLFALKDILALAPQL